MKEAGPLILKRVKQALACFAILIALFFALWAYQLHTVSKMVSRPLAVRDLGNGVTVEVWWEIYDRARTPLIGWLDIRFPNSVSARYRLNGTEYRQSLDIVEDAFNPSNMPQPIRDVLDDRR
ncbi:MAG: hypothetical protein RL088_1408 [Verrucomicrobiota bacterium]